MWSSSEFLWQQRFSSENTKQNQSRFVLSVQVYKYTHIYTLYIVADVGEWKCWNREEGETQKPRRVGCERRRKSLKPASIFIVTLHSAADDRPGFTPHRCLKSQSLLILHWFICEAEASWSKIELMGENLSRIIYFHLIDFSGFVLFSL